jgi:transposase
MQHRNTVLYAILNYLPWQTFEKLVLRCESDKHVRTLPTKAHFIALAYGQLAGLSGLRETVTALNSHAAQLYHVGGCEVRRSTLSDANAHRPSTIFEQLFASVMAQAHRGLRQELNQVVRLIDSTPLRLNRLSEDWARFSADVCGAKVHVVYDPDANQPVYAAFSKPRINDITAAKAMPIEPGATYVFDLGYYDYAWWAKMHAAGCRIVTRLKTNTKLTLTLERLMPTGHAILSDRIGYLPERQAKNRRNPFEAEVREVRVRIDTGKTLRIMTNDLTSPAQVIADLYKRRWLIELFFRWLKQTLAIRKFIGTSENAVRSQVFVALTVFLLQRLAHAGQTAVKRPLDFIRLARVHLMGRRDIRHLDGSPTRPDTAAGEIDSGLSGAFHGSG